MAEQYFVVRNARKVDGGVRFSGQFIVDGSVVANGSTQDDDPPKIDFHRLEPFVAKWILGPNGEGREFAESMGYETVEHDDFSYPDDPRR